MFISFLLCLFVFSILFRKAIKNKKRRKVIIIFLGILFIIGLLSAKAAMGFIPVPMWIRSVTHLIIEPKDLFKPIITDNFPFYEKGFAKTYYLKPKYLDYYEMGFLNEKEGKFLNYSFKSKIKVQFFWKDKLLFEKITTPGIRGGYMEKEGKYFQEVSFLKFGIPLQGKYKENISVKLTVLEPDEDLRKYGDFIKLFVRVNTHP